MSEPISGRSIMTKTTIGADMVFEKLHERYRSQSKEFALKNLKPTRVYIGYFLLGGLKLDASLFRLDGSAGKRGEIFGCVIYEVGDDPEHIHFC